MKNEEKAEYFQCVLCLRLNEWNLMYVCNIGESNAFVTHEYLSGLMKKRSLLTQVPRLLRKHNNLHKLVLCSDITDVGSEILAK